MSARPNRLRTPLLLCSLFITLNLFSQIRIVSPYSRFGIGDLADNNNAWNMSMGQLGIGIRSPLHVNYANPASYAAIDSLSFLFEGSFNGQWVTLTSNTMSTSRDYASLGCLLFGMPVTRWWKTSLGLIPYSDVGYNVVTYDDFPTTGRTARTYSGSGGINRLYWGNAIKIYKELSVGFNLSYLFGTMSREATVTFPDSATAMNTRRSFDVTLNDLHVDFGAQYRVKLKNDLFLNMGAVWSPSMKLSARTDILAISYLVTTAGTETARDTMISEKGASGKIVIPTRLGGGISAESTDKWIVGMDFQWQNWKKFSAFDFNDSLVNSWRISIGGEIIPKIDNYKNYLALVRYRLGFTYNKTYLSLRGQNISEYAISAGFGFPLRGTKTMINVGAEYGSRGTVDKDLIRENYFRIVVGFSINERWFVKRKFY